MSAESSTHLAGRQAGPEQIQAWVEQYTSVPSTTDIQRVLRQEVPFSGQGEALLTLQTAAPLDLEYCAVHLHVGLVTRSGGNITHVHPSQLVYAYQGATAEFKLGWRISYENGEVGPGGGSCGTGCTIDRTSRRGWAAR